MEKQRLENKITVNELYLDWVNERIVSGGNEKGYLKMRNDLIEELKELKRELAESNEEYDFF